jgi:hypothetical protein
VISHPDTASVKLAVLPAGTIVSRGARQNRSAEGVELVSRFNYSCSRPTFVTKIA